MTNAYLTRQQMTGKILCGCSRDGREFCREHAPRLVYDLKNHILADDSPTGLINFMSYERLAETLRANGEIKPRETLTHFTMDHRGITYRVVTR